MTSFSTAAVGMMGQQKGMDVTANNIANLTTGGYKADRAAFADLLYTNIKEETGDSYLKAGTGSKLDKTDTSFVSGGTRRTGQEFDYALSDSRNFFAVDTNAGVRYTRNGHFQKSLGDDGNYYLADTEGHYVLDENDAHIPITEQNPKEPGVYTFQNLDGLRKSGDSFFQPTALSGQASNVADGRIKKGYLEDSGVDLSQEFSNMISQQRAYEMNAKMVQMSDEVMQTVNGLR